MSTQNQLVIKSFPTRDVQPVAKIHPDTLVALDLVEGDYLFVKGKKKSETVLMVYEDVNTPPETLSVPSFVMSTLLSMDGDKVIVEPCHDIKIGKAVGIQVSEGSPLTEVAKKVKEFFLKRNLFPVCRGNFIPMDEKHSFRVLECDPVVYCLVSHVTEIKVHPKQYKDIKSEMERMKYDGYDNIGGCSRQLAQIKEMIDLPLRHPELFQSVGVTQPRGILLYGPPGTGKTLIAKAVANETGAFFFTINGPEVMSKMAGESEANLRKVFKEAEDNSPSIIFIDEIDSMAPRRDKSAGEVDKRVVSQLLTLMDGMKPRSSVLVVAATNRPNSIDPALRRYGRFDREINVGVPDHEGRLEILKIHTRKLKIARDVNLDAIALRTQGFVGADLAQVCTEAAMHCIRDNTKTMNVETDKPIDEHVLKRIEVTKDHFERALRTSKPANLREEMVEIPNVSWEDVGGLEEVKRKLIEMIQLPLENPALFEDFGLAPPKGVLFYGPPGCGKTLIAKAVATQCHANFISVKGPELLTKWFGESESNVRELFEKARQASPCILFFDEIDSIAKARGSGFGGDSTSSALDRVINQILTEMDGISSTKQVFVIGATNRPETIDGALLRPGRLDQLIYIPLPDEKSRISILRAGLKKSPLDPSIAKDSLLETLAVLTEGYSGADLVEICQRSTRYALRDVLSGTRKERYVVWENFETAVKEVRKSVSPQDIVKYDRFEKSMV